MEKKYPALFFPRFDGEKIELVTLIDGVTRVDEMTVAEAVFASAKFGEVAAQAIAAKGK